MMSICCPFLGPKRTAFRPSMGVRSKEVTKTKSHLLHTPAARIQNLSQNNSHITLHFLFFPDTLKAFPKASVTYKLFGGERDDRHYGHYDLLCSRTVCSRLHL